jgi:hypothetical protein
MASIMRAGRIARSYMGVRRLLASSTVGICTAMQWCCAPPTIDFGGTIPFRTERGDVDLVAKTITVNTQRRHGHTFGTHAAMFGANPWRLMTRAADPE